MLNILRGIFIASCALIGWQLGAYVYAERGDFFRACVSAAGGFVGLLVVALEIGFTRRFISIISVIICSILVGFVLSGIFVRALFLLPLLEDVRTDVKALVEVAVIFIFCYLTLIAILQSKDEFKFVIPFIEFARERKFGKSWILDTSCIIDGRIADVCESRWVDVPLVVPRFVINELQQVADSADPLKRNRGRRGLDVLNRLRKNRRVDLQIQDILMPDVDGVDSKLVRLAKTTDARVVTNDFNLNKVAQLEGVEVVNMNDLANALKPIVFPGEGMEVRIVKAGEQPGQGVGYLDDGTMIVVEGAASRIGQRVQLNVTNVLQTSAGRMIFGAMSGEPTRT